MCDELIVQELLRIRGSAPPDGALPSMKFRIDERRLVAPSLNFCRRIRYLVYPGTSCSERRSCQFNLRLTRSSYSEAHVDRQPSPP
jgi:hypothetical protein